MIVFSRNIIVNMPHVFGNMRMFQPLLLSSSSTIGLAIKTTIALAIILLTSNVTIGFAQQQEQQMTSQPSATDSESLTRTAPSKEDSFRIQVPPGWVIQDVDNTGFALAVEVLEGYGILAQLCPGGEEEQRQGVQLNASGNTSINSANSGSICQETQEEVIHIVRYPNIGARLGLASDDLISNNNVSADIILAYQMQKLQEGGYRDIRIVNSAHTTINVDLNTGLNNNDSMTTTVPAKLVEMTYRTNLSPDETRRGYFLSTATDVTPPNLGTIKGYALFYEGNSSSTNNTTTADSAEIITTSGDNSLSLAAIGQVFDSFELIAAPEVAQAIAQEAAEEGESLPVTNATATNATATNATEINTEAADIAGEGIDGDAGDADGTASALDTDAGDAADDEGGDAADDEGGDAADDEGGDGDDATNAIDVDAEDGDDNGGGGDDNGGGGDGTDTACDPSYPDDCIPSPPPDLDCGDDGIPENFKVLPPDPHEFDDDNDGIGCESESNQQSGLAEEPDSPGSNDSLSIVDIINWAIDGFPRL